MRKQINWFVVLLTAASPATLAAQNPAGVSLISIVLEMKSGDAVRTVDPTHVFEGGDTVRLRLKPAVDGYLYVMLRWARQMSLDLSSYPALAAFITRMQQRPAVTAALAAEGIAAV